MGLVSAWVGAVTPDSARVVATIEDGDTEAELHVDTDPDFADPAVFGPETADMWDTVRFTITGLAPDTQYQFAVAVDSTGIDEDLAGSFRTHPPASEPAEFTVAVIADAGSGPDHPGEGDVLASDRVSNAPVFAEIRGRDPLFLAHLGDLHYYDLGGVFNDRDPTLANYVRGYDDVLAQPNQHDLYRHVPTVYMWDDHDYGPNDSDSSHVGRGEAQQAYRVKVPHYDLPSSEGIFHSFEVGRVLFVVMDSRSDRDPNDDPDGPNKTLLGGPQKTWMRQTLEASDAELLVWLQSERLWHAPDTVLDADGWWSFADERDELAAMLTELGWADRMLSVHADLHNMGIDTGSSNSFGGWPVAQFAPMDSGTHSNGSEHWDIDWSAERAQYGTIHVADDGAEITVTLTGWVGGQAVMSHELTVDTAPDEEPEPEPEPLPPISTAEIRTEVTWLACDLTTGRIIAELPDLMADSVSRVIGSHTSTRLQVPIPLAGGRPPLRTVEQATGPARTMIVAVVNAVPVWAGIVLDRVGGTDGTLQLATVSLEGYLEHRIVRDHRWSDQDEVAVIARGLLADADAPVDGIGAGIGLQLDTPATGTLRSRDYAASDHATVYERLRELMGVEGGPEWTIDVDWADDRQTRVAKIARVRGRIGDASDAIFQATASSVFAARGSASTRYKYTEDRSGDRYANVVLAYSSGEGEDQPVSAPAVDREALEAGAPIWERHWQPSSSISSVQVLDQHARADLRRRRHGAVTWDITARWDTWPRYGVDWRLGDDVAFELHGHRHPDGIRGVARVIGFDLDLDAGTLTPVLLDPLEDITT